MKKSLRIFAILALLGSSNLIVPNVSAWSPSANIAVSVFGGTLREEARSMALDSNGNIYTTGYFNGIVDFDPSDGVAELSSSGSHDIFILKSDPNGNLIWVKRIGGSNADAAAAISIDRSGGVVITGNFGGGGGGTVDFDPGVGVDNLTSSGDDDIFVLKLDSSGNYLWAKSMGGLERDTGVHIAVDTDGNIGATGIFNSTADFDPTQGTDNRTSAGDWDVFISKFDSSGNHLWTKTRGGRGKEVGQGIAFDSGGNIYSLGLFNEIVDFDPGVGVADLTSNGGPDMFISKFDSSGNYLWAKRIGNEGSDGAAQAAFDRTGNLYFTGFFSGTVDFDPSDDGVAELTSLASGEMFVSKFDSSGNFLWAKRRGGAGADRGFNIAVDGSGNIYSTGFFAGTVDFDPGVGVADLTSNGDSDIFIAKFDSSGNHLWAKGIGGTEADRGLNIAVDTSGNVFTSGFFSNTVDFDPGTGTSNFTSNGGLDMFTLKLDTNGNSPLVAAVSAGSAPNSKVATIPSGVTEAAIAKTNDLPAIKLNFGGSVPTAVTVVPVLTNPATQSTTPFALSDSIKIVEITLSSPHDGSPVTICLDGASTDRLYHYTNSAWVELSSQNYVNGQVCGVTTSFSPFAAAPPSPVAAPVAPMLPTNKPVMTATSSSIMCTMGTHSQTPTSSVFSLFVDGEHISTNFSAVGDYLPSWIIPWASAGTITRTATLTSATWAMNDAYKGKQVSCTTLAYSAHATGLTSSEKMMIK